MKKSKIFAVVLVLLLLFCMSGCTDDPTQGQTISTGDPTQEPTVSTGDPTQEQTASTGDPTQGIPFAWELYGAMVDSDGTVRTPVQMSIQGVLPLPAKGALKGHQLQIEWPEGVSRYMHQDAFGESDAGCVYFSDRECYILSGFAYDPKENCGIPLQIVIYSEREIVCFKWWGQDGALILSTDPGVDLAQVRAELDSFIKEK